MKHFFIISLCFLALSLSAQTDGWEYPFPYNPDGDADGYITLSDLLDLLALYGNEYPESFHYDDSGAILSLGQLSLHDCYNQARAAEGNWRLPNRKDIMRWADYLVQEFEEIQTANFPDNYSYDVEYTMHANDESKNILKSEVRITKTTSGNTVIDVLENISGWNHYEYSTLSQSQQVFNCCNDYCYIVTQVRPAIEYTYCGPTATIDCVNQKLSEGWYILGGVSGLSQAFQYQALWRWAVE
jgi:hypothetical protein